ncbi:MAG: hypothetical protein IM561_09065 [Microcystis sp. M60BS1]|uniref:hypothetical protein n=1 Tax=unclassified Microcystis TaxID=2643300 RepID=UPI0025798305|nr:MULTISPECIES: hypothetical protein [unclassified Microcystis]MCA2594358.1 hypothetical protein [Microcystis sp. M38BS1]MCA6581465.1 hypothetical protein [Pseudanabaena sp. M34BS1SP1A06MG]MCA2510519.1 hypothetical protein [Microcystis sp. M60BS1]MCA2555753.1 hypothetical protein [Microcystis sp. M43BS1]MCA2603418.1 hypothetical protein [Microcystis sp. M26BS1]
MTKYYVIWGNDEEEHSEMLDNVFLAHDRSAELEASTNPPEYVMIQKVEETILYDSRSN